MKPLILASLSPSRKEILEEAGIPFTIDVGNYEEDMGLQLPPHELAIFLSRGKAQEVAARQRGAVVLGADSFAVFDGQLLGKPHTMERAMEMLRMMSGKRHSFITGFTVIDTVSNKEHRESVESHVYFRDLSDADIADYLAREPDALEKAGAYKINGLGKSLVERTEGDYENIRGLPIASVIPVLRTFGVGLPSE